MRSLKRPLALVALTLAAALGAAWIVSLNLTEPKPRSPHAGAPAPLSPQQLQGVAIAPVEQALTFARFRDAHGLRLMRVLRYEDGQVSGIDITAAQQGTEPADPVTLWNQAGHDAIARAEGPAVTVPAGQLERPFEGTDAQIAMGATYPDHAKEATIEQPFAFPKLLAPGRWNMVVPARDFLLDYEIELGFVLLQPAMPGRQPPTFGLVLASDYTDRARMLREIDIGQMHSGQGFVGAKSLVPAMPVGALLVIPRDARSFYRTLELRLHVNGELRQIARPERLAWPIDRMLQEAFARREVAFRHPGGAGGSAVRLPVSEAGIPARTIVLSGTTDGVAFRPPSGRQIFLGVLHWLASGRWGEPQRVVERSITEAYRDRHHLQPGDQVVMRADGLGLIVNTIER